MIDIKKILTEDEIIDQIYSYEKGASAVQHILEHYEVKFSKKELLNEIKANTKSSALTSSIIKLLLKEGFEVEARQMTIDDLTVCLDHKIPVMVLCGENYLTAMSYDDKFIYFKEENNYITHQELLTKWVSEDKRLNNFGIIVGNKKINESSIIDIPLISQAFSYDCGAAAIKAVLGYYGENIKEEKIINGIKTDSRIGTEAADMVSYLKELGYDAELKHMKLDEVKQNLDKKIPVIITLQAHADEKNTDYSKTWKEGHYVVAIGYDDKKIYFQDPSLMNRAYLTFDELNERWHDIEQDKKEYNLAIAVKGKKPDFDKKEIVHMESVNFPNHENVNYLLLDMDHVVLLYDKFCENYKLTSGFISILKQRKQNKITWEQAVKKTGINPDRIKIILNTICEHSKFNPEIKLLIEKFSKKYPELQVVITSDNSPYVVAYFLTYHKLDKYFNFLWCPEKAEWHWKKDKEYFELLQKKIGTEYRNMLLVDNDVENTREFDLLGGQSIHYDKGNYTFDTHERIG